MVSPMTKMSVSAGRLPSKILDCLATALRAKNQIKGGISEVAKKLQVWSVQFDVQVVLPVHTTTKAAIRGDRNKKMLEVLGCLLQRTNDSKVAEVQHKQDLMTRRSKVSQLRHNNDPRNRKKKEGQIEQIEPPHWRPESERQ